MLDVTEIVVHRLVMPLQMRFETSFGVQTDRDLILVEVRTRDGLVGWGESVAARSPLYNEETTDTVQAILIKELIPLTLNTPWVHPSEFLRKTAFLHGIVWPSSPLRVRYGIFGRSGRVFHYPEQLVGTS